MVVQGGPVARRPADQPRLVELVSDQSHRVALGPVVAHPVTPERARTRQTGRDVEQQLRLEGWIVGPVGEDGRDGEEVRT